jgi:hypothetical protein
MACGSWFSLEQQSRPGFEFSALDSRLSTARFMVQGAWFMASGSGCMVHGNAQHQKDPFSFFSLNAEL